MRILMELFTAYGFSGKLFCRHLHRSTFRLPDRKMEHGFYRITLKAQQEFLPDFFFTLQPLMQHSPQ